jgi:hypothetical protein
MKLLTKEIIKNFPKWRSTDGKEAKDIQVIAKFFTPWSNWTWYAVEYDLEDSFFGYVRGLDKELGYFSLKDLESITGPGGLKIERDRHFGKHTLEEVMEKDL